MYVCMRCSECGCTYVCVCMCIAGKAESLGIGVSGVENCSEVERAKALTTGGTRSSVGREKANASCVALELSDDGLEDGCIFQSNLGHTTVSFDNSNPHQAAHKKVTIKNMRYTCQRTSTYLCTHIHVLIQQRIYIHVWTYTAENIHVWTYAAENIHSCMDLYNRDSLPAGPLTVCTIMHSILYN